MGKFDSGLGELNQNDFRGGLESTSGYSPLSKSTYLANDSGLLAQFASGRFTRPLVDESVSNSLFGSSTLDWMTLLDTGACTSSETTCLKDWAYKKVNEGQAI
jgi:hypothetical protein